MHIRSGGDCLEGIRGEEESGGDVGIVEGVERYYTAQDVYKVKITRKDDGGSGRKGIALRVLQGAKWRIVADVAVVKG